MKQQGRNIELDREYDEDTTPASASKYCMAKAGEIIF